MDIATVSFWKHCIQNSYKQTTACWSIVSLSLSKQFQLCVQLYMCSLTNNRGLLHKWLLYESFHKDWSDPWINFLLPLECYKFSGSAWNVDPREAVMSPWHLFTFYKTDAEQYFCIKYVSVTGDDGTWIQTEEGDYDYSRLLWFSANRDSVIIIHKIILLPQLVAILFE